MAINECLFTSHWENTYLVSEKDDIMDLLPNIVQRWQITFMVSSEEFYMGGILGVWSIFASKCQLICLKKSMSLNIIFQHIFFWLERCCKFATSSLFQNFLWPCKGWLWIVPSWWKGMKCIIWFACQCLHDHLGKSEIKT